MTAPRDDRAVREHYARLASEYAEKANPACQRAYRELVARIFAGARRVLELGAGASDAISHLGSPLLVTCDLSGPMLSARFRSRAHASVADAAALPFADAAFDAVFCINLLEHVPEPAQVAAEAARVLARDGLFLAITPNGDAEWLLDALERVRLKLPEGPHRFLAFDDLAALAGSAFTVVEHRRFLAFPAGPHIMVNAIDRCTGGWGLFQYILLKKR